MKKLFLLLLLGFSLAVFSQDTSKVFHENYDKGMEHYNKAQDLQNKHLKEGFRACAIPTDVVQEYELALPHLEKAYKINPKNETLLKSLMIIYFHWASLGRGKKRGKEYYAKSEKCKQEYDTLVAK